MQTFHRRTGQCPLSPKFMSSIYKHIFAYLKENGVIYEKGKDFNGKGGFHGFWKEIYRLATSFRTDLGKKPNKAAVDHNAEYKIRCCANPPYDPYNNYKDCLELLIHYTLKLAHGRGGEVRQYLNIVYYIILMCLKLFIIYFMN